MVIIISSLYETKYIFGKVNIKSIHKHEELLKEMRENAGVYLNQRFYFFREEHRQHETHCLEIFFQLRVPIKKDFLIERNFASQEMMQNSTL